MSAPRHLIFTVFSFHQRLIHFFIYFGTFVSFQAVRYYLTYVSSGRPSHRRVKPRQFIERGLEDVSAERVAPDTTCRPSRSGEDIRTVLRVSDLSRRTPRGMQEGRRLTACLHFIDIEMLPKPSCIVLASGRLYRRGQVFCADSITENRLPRRSWDVTSRLCIANI